MDRVFTIFENILSVPRSSGKEEKIAKFLEKFANDNNLECHIGKYHTVFLRKDNHSDKTIVLQGHSDMVCVSDKNYDFDNKGIPFYIDGDYYKAHGTSLGADDGIGLAIILAMLTDDNDNLPNIEAIITTQEETTMMGALNFDYSKVTGNTIINIDGVKEGEIECSCAGMCSITFKKKISYCSTSDSIYKLNISGLKGGHSGDAIDKNRCNAIKLTGKILDSLNYKHILDINIGTKINVIPSSGYVIFTSLLDYENLNHIINSLNLDLTDDDKNLKLTLEQVNDKKVINESNDIINIINDLPYGVLNTYEDNFPLISANIGKISIQNEELRILYSIRSSDKLEEEKLINKVKSIAKKNNFEINIDSQIPFLEYKEISHIRNLLADTYKKLYQKEVVINKIHACTECGVISGNIKDADICTIAPDIDDIHSVNEKVSISSTKRVFNWLKETLIKYNEED